MRDPTTLTPDRPAAAEVLRRNDAALLAGEVGTYYWDLVGDRVYGDRNFVPMFGVQMGPAGWLPVEAFIEVIHPDDRDKVRAAIDASLRTDAPFEIEYRIVSGPSQRWVIARGKVERDDAGNPVAWPGIVVDITARKSAEEMLRVGAQQYRELFTSMDAGYCIIDVLFDDRDVPYDYRFVLTNPAFDRQTGLSDVIGKTIRELVPGFDGPWFETYGRVARTGQAVRFIDHAPAMGRWFEVNAFAVGPAGRDQVAALFTNITDRKRAEAAVESDARQRDALLELQRATSAAKGEDGVMSAAAEKVLAVVPRAKGSAVEIAELDAATGKSWLVYRAVGGAMMAEFAGFKIARTGSLSGLALDEGRPQWSDDCLNDERVDKEGCRRTGIRSMIVVPIVRGGEFAGVLKLASDQPRTFTEADLLAAQLAVGAIATGLSGAAEAKAIEALRQSEAQFRLIADATPQIVWVTGPDGFHEYFNKRWYEYIGPDSVDTDDRLWTAAMHPEDADRARALWGHSLKTGESYEVELRFHRHDGQYRWFLARALPVRDHDGSIVKWYGTCTDIHEQKQLAAERERLFEVERSARAEAERAGRMKDEFVATLSHELRTPLNAILGWTSILSEPTATAEDYKEGLETIGRNARAQSQIIEDLLDMSRIVSGKIRLDVQTIGPAAVINAAVETVKTAAVAKDIRLQVVIDPAAGPIRGDPSRLQQVLWNLLSNAIKFTPNGGQVRIGLERVDSHVRIDIVDTGEGIAADFLPFMFDRFRQADSSTTRRHGGLGLGLAIVKHILELHGGTIRAHSPGPGMGSTFSVDLPAVAPDRASAPSPAPRAKPVRPNSPVNGKSVELKGVRVLVVDDEPDALTLVKRLLEDCHAVVTTAASAADAYQQIQSDPPDLLISDIGMPVEDGYSLVRRMRSLPAERGGRTPAIALTAYARAEDRVKAVVAGFQHHVAKPVEPAELLATVASLVPTP